MGRQICRKIKDGKDITSRRSTGKIRVSRESKQERERDRHKKKEKSGIRKRTN